MVPVFLQSRVRPLPDRARQELRHSRVEGGCQELPHEGRSREPCCGVPLCRHTGQPDNLGGLGQCLFA